MTDPNTKAEITPFIPTWWGRSGTLQTILSSIWPQPNTALPGSHMEIPLTDGDRILCKVDRPHSWKSGDPFYLIVHGLTGSSESLCVSRLTEALFLAGKMCIRMNLRGCGDGEGLAHQVSHCGRSADVHEVCTQLHKTFPGSPLHLVGFSKGGNIALKAGAEISDKPDFPITTCIAICPPIDLEACVRYLGEPQRCWIDQYFVTKLKRSTQRHHHRFPELGTVHFARKMSLYDFDDCYTAPQCGFDNAHDYYQQSSAKKVLHNCARPTLIVAAKDDPCIPLKIFDEIPYHPLLRLTLSEYGGHIAFVGQNKGQNWLANLVLQWSAS
ncbi:MAG: alpha/beta fold hydrolase [Zetaproteobacteria bacterium]|nr:alpha/beta fold hydrolase [Zetaproteobacteria bacterium]